MVLKNPVYLKARQILYDNFFGWNGLYKYNKQILNVFGPIDNYRRTLKLKRNVLFEILL